MTRLRRAGPVNNFVDKDPLKQWVSAFVAVCRNGSPFAEKGRKIFFSGGEGFGGFSLGNRGSERFRGGFRKVEGELQVFLLDFRVLMDS